MQCSVLLQWIVLSLLSSNGRWMFIQETSKILSHAPSQCSIRQQRHHRHDRRMRHRQRYTAQTVAIVAPRGSNSVTIKYNRVARNEYAAARTAIATETWKTDPPIRFVTSPMACAIKRITNPVPENHMTDSDWAGPRSSDSGFDSTLEYGFGSKPMSSKNERRRSTSRRQKTMCQNRG